MKQHSGRSDTSVCEDYPPLAGDPDIAGLGIVISFCLLCFLTMFFTWPFFSNLPEPEPEHFPSWSDRVILRYLKKAGWYRPVAWTPKADRHEEMRRSLVLALSDTQLFTGIAIMVAARIKHDISAYHFALVSDMVWLAAGGHLTALNYAAPWLREYPVIRNIRGAAFLGIQAAIAWTLVVQGHRDFFWDPATPLECFIPLTPSDLGGENETAMLGYLVLLLTENIHCILKLWPRLADGVKALDDYMMSRTGELFRRPKRHFDPYDRGNLIRARMSGPLLLDMALWALVSAPLFWIWRISHYIGVILFELLEGMMLLMLIDWMWLGLGAWWIQSDKAWARPEMEGEEWQVEHSWGFGQIVPMVLVLAPLWSMGLAWMRARYDEASKGQGEDDQQQPLVEGLERTESVAREDEQDFALGDIDPRVVV